MFSHEEQQVLWLLGEAFNAFSKLPELHPADKSEFVLYTHALQNLVIQRPGARHLYGIEQPTQELLMPPVPCESCGGVARHLTNCKAELAKVRRCTACGARLDSDGECANCGGEAHTVTHSL